MAAVQPLGTSSAFIKVEIAFPDNWNNPTTWTDVTSHVRFAGGGVQWNRGRNDEYQQVTPGTCQITFNNRDRAFDPTYASSPYYPYIDPARPVRITCYWPTTSTSYIQFYGVIEDWVTTWEPGGDSVCVASGVELLGMLSYAKITVSSFISTTVPARLADLCNAAGIPAAHQSFSSGPYALTAQQYQQVDALSACQGVVAGEAQVFYSTRDGILKNAGMFTGTSSSIGTFGDGAGELAYVSVSPSVGTGYLYTQVAISAAAPAGGTAPPTVTKNVSSAYISRYGSRQLALSVAAIGQANAQTAANSIATSLAAQSLTREKTIMPRPMRDPTNIWPVVLAADFGNVIAVKATPPGGGTRFSQNAKIRSIAHNVTLSGWDVTWNLSP